MTTPRQSFAADLPAELESAVAARRILDGAARAWSLPDRVAFDAAVAVSELVTNAVLHARTAVRVRVRRAGAGVRIEVEDGDPYLPALGAARPEDLVSNQSMTGRGLALVAAMCERWGSAPKGSGKVTWAEVGTGGGEPVEAPSVPARGDRRRAGRSGRVVHIIGAPVSVVLESTRQLSDLQREVQVMALARDAPPELAEIISTAPDWVPDIDSWTDNDRLLAERAAAEGRQTLDFDVFVPDDVARRIEGIAAWLARVAASVDRRQLLTLPASSQVVAYRRWYAAEILRQLAGDRPRPCPPGAGAPYC